MNSGTKKNQSDCVSVTVRFVSIMQKYSGNKREVQLEVSTDPAQADAFRARYGVAQSVALYGPYDGNLANNGERIALTKPTTPLTNMMPKKNAPTVW